jgi:hypothetical protein
MKLSEYLRGFKYCCSYNEEYFFSNSLELLKKDIGGDIINIEYLIEKINSEKYNFDNGNTVYDIKIIFNYREHIYKLINYVDYLNLKNNSVNLVHLFNSFYKFEKYKITPKIIEKIHNTENFEYHFINFYNEFFQCHIYFEKNMYDILNQVLNNSSNLKDTSQIINFIEKKFCLDDYILVNYN